MTRVDEQARSIIDQIDQMPDAWATLVDAITVRGLEHQGFTNWETWAVWQWLHADAQRLQAYIEGFRPHLREDTKIEHYFLDLAKGQVIHVEVFNTLLTAAIRSVDWFQILERMDQELIGSA